MGLSKTAGPGAAVSGDSIGESARRGSSQPGRCMDHPTGRPDRLTRLQVTAAERRGICLDVVCTKFQAKYRFRCAAGHEWSAWGHLILAGKWCPQCANNAKRLTIDAMQAMAAKRGGRCLSTQYGGCRVKLTWMCQAGHVWEASPRDIRNRGTWCRICARQKGARGPRKSGIARHRT